MPSTLQRITLAFSLSYLAACAGGISLNGTPDAVDGRQPPTQNVNWYWLGGAGMMDQVIVNHPQNYILNTKSSSATIVADCNQGAADLDKTAEGRIWLEKFQISKNICPQGSQAQSFIAGLKDAAQSEVRGDMLRLHRRDYGSTMILSLDPKAELSLYRCPSSETMVVILSGNNAVV